MLVYQCQQCSKQFDRKWNAERHIAALSACSSFVEREESVEEHNNTTEHQQLVHPQIMTFQQHCAFIEGFVPDQEEVEKYVAIFAPFVCNNFNSFLLQTVQSTVYGAPDILPQRAIDISSLWFRHYAHLHLKLCSGHVRAATVFFDAQSVGDSKMAHHNTLTYRDRSDKVEAELDAAIKFIFNNKPTELYPIINEFYTKWAQGYSDQMFIQSGWVPRLLSALFLEERRSVFGYSSLQRLALARCFALKSNDPGFSMIACGTSGRRLSALLNLLGIAICSHTTLFDHHHIRGTSEQQAREYAKLAANCSNSGILASHIRVFRTMDAAKVRPKSSAVYSSGDIGVGPYLFKRTIWQDLIPRVVALATENISKVLDGEWSDFLESTEEIALVMEERRMESFKWRSDNDWKSSTNITIKQSISGGTFWVCYDMLVSIAELSLFGLGCGSMRKAETDRLTFSKISLYGNCLYYAYVSRKTASLRAKQLVKDPVEHKLSPRVTRIVLVILHLINKAQSREGAPILQGPDEILVARSSRTSSMGRILQMIFDFPNAMHAPQPLQIRHFFNSIMNVVFPNEASDLDQDGDVVLYANNEASQQSGHTATTQRNSYQSLLVDGPEKRMMTFHTNLGESYGGYTSENIAIPVHIIQDSLKSIFGSDACFYSQQQQSMCMTTCNPRGRNSLYTIGCGGGKSLSWLIWASASRKLGRTGTTIVVLPMAFLVYHHAFVASESLPNSNIGTLFMPDIIDDELPFASLKRVPDLIFATTDAFSKLIDRHDERFVEGLGVKLIFLDEVQVYLTDSSFRHRLRCVKKVTRYGVRVVALSGSLPTGLVPAISEYLGLGSEGAGYMKINHEESDELLHRGFYIQVRILLTPMDVIVSSRVQKYLKDCAWAVHIICGTKEGAKRIMSKLGADTTEARLVIKTSAREERQAIAEEWKMGY